ncbi:MAG: DUF2062 domain-containing protein [Gammaproteobacteria bacterium]|nr:DUF2062 domain-containing protein [Gammaproteobacteria bacterium]MDH5629831.1 DUF2062 domain-containing protein [Gammaproteobacteria bacterium]
MPRKLIKQYLPDPHNIKNNKFLKIFGKVLHDPQLWHLTRFSVGHAVVVGLFCAFIPVPFQMLLAAGGAILFRANIAISVALVWITNPVTMPFLFGFAYLVGNWVVGTPNGAPEIELSFSALWDSLFHSDALITFLWGCLICGVVAAILGYLLVRLFWRLHIVKAWEARKAKRSAQMTEQ